MPKIASQHSWTMAEYEMTNIAAWAEMEVRLHKMPNTTRVDQVVTWYQAALRCDVGARDLYRAIAFIHQLTHSQRVEYFRNGEPLPQPDESAWNPEYRAMIEKARAALAAKA